MTDRCAFTWVLGDRSMSCDGTPAAVLTIHRLAPVQSQQRVHVCDRHLGHAVAALEPESDMPLEVAMTAHGHRLYIGAGLDCFPSVLDAAVAS